MNAQREIREANRRVQEQIDASARAALERIGVDVDAMEREAAEQRAREIRESFVAFGDALGSAFTAIIAFAEDYLTAVVDALKEPRR
jgi:hypothetical protein